MPTIPAAFGPMIDEHMKKMGQTEDQPGAIPFTAETMNDLLDKGISKWRNYSCQYTPVEPDISEKMFTAKVLKLAKDWGWRTAHFRPAWTREGKMVTAVQGDGKGWLDITLVRERLIVAELKRGKNKPTPEQTQWIEAWQRAGVPVFVWYPRDWAEILSIVARPCQTAAPPQTCERSDSEATGLNPRPC